MEADKVPQDDTNILEGKLKVLKYAVDKDGNYTSVKSVGWEPENIVLSQAWDDINAKVEEVRKKVIAGELSPIAYYMEKQMLELDMVAGYVGYPKFRVKWHLKPKIFKKLNEKQLDKYAYAFRITREQLLNIE